MKFLIFVLALSFTHTVFADDEDSSDSQPTPPAVSTGAPVTNQIIPLDFDLGRIPSRDNAVHSVQESVRDFLNENPDCLQQKYRYCDVYLPSSSGSENMECDDGYTFVSNENLGVFIDRRRSPPIPAGMSRPTLEQLIRTSRPKAIVLGVCRRI